MFKPHNISGCGAYGVGKPVGTACFFGGHLFDQCLTHQISLQSLKMCQTFRSSRQNLRVYTPSLRRTARTYPRYNTNCINNLSRTFASQKSELSNDSETSKLMVTYLQILGIVRTSFLVEDNRTLHCHATYDCFPIFSDTRYRRS